MYLSINLSSKNNRKRIEAILRSLLNDNYVFLCAHAREQSKEYIEHFSDFDPFLPHHLHIVLPHVYSAGVCIYACNHHQHYYYYHYYYYYYYYLVKRTTIAYTSGVMALKDGICKDLTKVGHCASY